MSNIKGYLVERDNRSLFIRDIAEASWALEDGDYLVTPLVAMKPTDVYEQFVPDAPQPTDETQERLQLLEQIYELEEQQIAVMKSKLEEAVELVENIHLFASNQTINIMEARGLLKLIAESCDKWLRPRE